MRPCMLVFLCVCMFSFYVRIVVYVDGNAYADLLFPCDRIFESLCLCVSLFTGGLFLVRRRKEEGTFALDMVSHEGKTTHHLLNAAPGVVRVWLCYVWLCVCVYGCAMCGCVCVCGCMCLQLQVCVYAFHVSVRASVCVCVCVCVNFVGGYVCRCLWACACACVHVKGALSIYVCCHIVCALCLSRSSRMARPPSHSTAHPRNWGRSLHSTISSTFSLRPTPSGLRPSHRCVVNKHFLLFCSWFVQGHTSCFV